MTHLRGGHREHCPPPGVGAGCPDEGRLVRQEDGAGARLAVPPLLVSSEGDKYQQAAPAQQTICLVLDSYSIGIGQPGYKSFKLLIITVLGSRLVVTKMLCHVFIL